MQETNTPETVEIYKAYIEDVNQLRASRLGENSIRVTIATLFLGAQAFIASLLIGDPAKIQITDPEFSRWIPFLTITLVGYLAISFCQAWKKLMEDLTDTINKKFTNLRRLEETYETLNTSGANLFIEEYKQRHPEYVSPWQRDANAPPSAAVERKPPSKPVRGAGLSAINLADFFLAVFKTVSVSAIVLKGVMVLANLLLESGIIQNSIHVLMR